MNGPERHGLRWLLQGVGASPTLNEGHPPPGLLNPLELETLAGFRSSKRRRDWLLGRWTAKHLVQIYLAEAESVAPSLAEILIDNEPNGAPFAALLSNGARPDLARRLALSLSISHSGHRSLCALRPGDDAQVGADIEQIEPRADDFVGQFFAAAEIAFIRDAERPDVAIAALWCAKEAAFKTLRAIRQADPRRLTCRLPASFLITDRWQAIKIELDPTFVTGARPSSSLQAWLRAGDGYTQSLCLRPT